MTESPVHPAASLPRTCVPKGSLKTRQWLLGGLVFALLSTVSAGAAHGADYSNTGDDGWPRASSAIDFGLYGTRLSNEAGSPTVTRSYTGGGLYINTCVFCIWTNERRLVFGDSQALHFGTQAGMLREGVLVSYGVTPDVDAGARLFFQWIDMGRIRVDGWVGQLDGRWKLVTASLAYRPGTEGYLGATVRVAIIRVLSANVFYDRMTVQYGAVATRASMSSLRLGFGMSF